MIKKYKNLSIIILMVIITAITQLLVLLKSSMVAGIFGTSMEMDAYNFANSIVSFIFGFIASGVSTIIIPNYAKKNSRKYVDSFITLLYIIMLVIVFTFIIFRFQIIGLFSNKNDSFINITSNILTLLLFSNYLLSFSNITEAYFQCKEKYILPKTVALFAQILIVIPLALIKNLTIIQYTYIISIGLVFNFIFDLIFAIKNGWRFKLSFRFRAAETKRLFKLFLPIILSTGVYKLSLVVDSIIASNLEVGKITILSYSTQIVNLVNTILVGTLLTYSYPKIIKKINDENNQVDFWKQSMFYHLIICFIICAFYCVGNDAVAFLFERGKFSTNDTYMVFLASFIYILGQQSNIIRDMIYRYFYAKGDTKVAAKNSFIISILNIILSIIFVKVVGFYGIILGTIISSFISLFLIIFKFSKKIGFKISRRKLLYQIIGNIIISMISVVLVIVTKNYISFNSLVLRILFFGFEVLFIFTTLTYISIKKFKFFKW